jgi:hypothetical protein
VAAHRPSQLAWYRDPDDPVRLRHWNGRTWDLRRRTVPAWLIATSEYAPVDAGRREGDPVPPGPVRAAGLPATATASMAASLPRPRPMARGRSLGVRPAGAGASATGRSLGTRPVHRPAWSRPRAALMTVSALVGIAVLILAATVGIAPRPGGATTLSQDTGFTRAAGIACAATMGAARLTPPTSLSAGGGAPSATPAAVATANRALASLANRIRSIPVAGSGSGGVQKWLDTWDRYAADRARQAGLAASPAGHGPTTGTSSEAQSLASAVDLDAAQADAFATTNGLGNCTLDAAGPVTAS